MYHQYEQLVDALSNAGALWIKIGQWLSVRNDILPRALCDSLEALHSEVGYHSPKYSEEVLERSFDASKMLKSFRRKPSNSGSIAQIHTARLKDGQEVAIKIVHPNVREEMEFDVKILTFLSRFLPAQMESFIERFRNQTDLRNEAKSIEIFSRAFSNVSAIKFPELLFASKDIIVMSKLPGDTQTNFAKQHPDRIQEVHMLKVVAYYKMVCQDNYIHGDFHPGNVLCHLNKDNQVELGIIDPSPCIRLTKSKKALKSYFYNMISLDSDKLSKLFLQCNVNEEARTRLFKKRIKKLRKIKDMNIIKYRMFEAVRESKMVLQGDLAFLILSFFLVHNQIIEYKKVHMKALVYIIKHKVFCLDSVIGDQLRQYLATNLAKPELYQLQNYLDDSIQHSDVADTIQHFDVVDTMADNPVLQNNTINPEDIKKIIMGATGLYKKIAKDTQKSAQIPPEAPSTNTQFHFSRDRIQGII